MEVLIYQVSILILIAILTVVIIVGVFMIQALADAKAALDNLNATISGLVLPVPVDHTADVQALTDGINAANQALKDKFAPAA